MKYLSVVTTVVVLSTPILSFSAPPRIPSPVERVERTQSYFLTPSINEVAIAEVGESLYKEGIRTVSKRYKAVIKSDVESKMDNGYVLSVKAGSGGQMMMRTGTHMPLLCFMTKPTGVMGFFGDKDVAGCLADTTGTQVFDKSMFMAYDKYFALSAPVPYDVQVTETESESPDDLCRCTLSRDVER